MKILGLSIVFATAMSASCSALAEDSANRTYSLMTFNIILGVKANMQRLSPRDAIYRPKNGIPEIIAAIRATRPDFVALQEVFRSSQAKQIAKATGYSFRYEPYFNRTDGREGPIGQAILSRHPIDAFNSLVLPGAVRPRKISLATIRLGSKKITLATLHRDHRILDGSDYRVIRSALRAVRGALLLAGDFNHSFPQIDLELKKAGLTNALNAVDSPAAREVRRLGTVSSGRTIDHIIVREKHVKIIAIGLLAAQYRNISDHRALIVKFRLLH